MKGVSRLLPPATRVQAFPWIAMLAVCVPQAFANVGPQFFSIQQTTEGPLAWLTCQKVSRVSRDCDGNGVPDQCRPVGCEADFNCDDSVDVQDLVALILEFDCKGPPDVCQTDINLDGEVDVQDLVLVILNWGDCPLPSAGCLTECNGLDEEEVCGDSSNAGCGADGQSDMIPLVSGDSVCGMTHATSGIRDSDWYILTTGLDGTVAITIVAEIPTIAVLVFDPTQECNEDQLIVAGFAHSDACEPGSFLGDAEPGQPVYLFVAPATADGQPIFGGFPCTDTDGTTNNQYRLTVQSH